MTKMFFKKVQSIQPFGFYPKPGTFYKNEKRRVILSKHEFILSKGYKNRILICFNINKRWINSNGNNK